MTTRHRPAAALAAAAALALVLAGCAGDAGDTDTGGLPTAEELGDPAGDQSLEEQGISAADCEADAPDCPDAVVDPAAGSCLAGDADCVDESNGGGDVARTVVIAPERSGAPAIERGATTGASGRFITRGHLVDDTTLELTFEGGACDLVEDVLVTESETEVRVLVLSAQDASVEMCTAEVTQWSTTITLEAPLGDRTLLDLAG